MLRYILYPLMLVAEILLNLVIAPIWILHDWVARKRAVYLGRKSIDEGHH